MLAGVAARYAGGPSVDLEAPPAPEGEEEEGMETDGGGASSAAAAAAAAKALVVPAGKYVEVVFACSDVGMAQALVEVSVLLFTVTFHANLAHNLTRSP